MPGKCQASQEPVTRLRSPAAGTDLAIMSDRILTLADRPNELADSLGITGLLSCPVALDAWHGAPWFILRPVGSTCMSGFT